VRRTDSIDGALEALRSFAVDIVVADLFIRTEHGADIVTELRARNHRPMPLGIAMSGIAAADSRHAIAACFHSFLTKPLNVESMKSAFAATIRVLAKRSQKLRKASS